MVSESNIKGFSGPNFAEDDNQISQESGVRETAIKSQRAESNKHGHCWTSNFDISIFDTLLGNCSDNTDAS